MALRTVKPTVQTVGGVDEEKPVAVTRTRQRTDNAGVLEQDQPAKTTTVVEPVLGEGPPPSPPPEDRDIIPPIAVPGPGEAAPTPEERRRAERFLEEARREPLAKPFKPPEGAKLVEETAKGKPAIYERAGVRYYAPDSTMYKIGYESSVDYLASQRRGTPPPYVAIMTDIGLAHIKRQQAINLSKLREKAQFRQLVNLGIIPRGSEYVAPVKEGESWTYLTPENVRAKLDIEKWAKETGKVEHLITSGLAEDRSRYLRWLVEEAPVIEAKMLTVVAFDKAMKALKPYKLPQPARYGFEMISGPPVQYDLLAAIRANVPEKHLLTLFGRDAVKEARQKLRQLGEEIPAYDTVSLQALEDAVGKSWYYKGQLITGKDRQQLIDYFEENRGKKLFIDDPRQFMVQQKPALVLAADKRWQKLKDRPKDDPERMAFLAEWQKKLIDTIAFASAVVSPQIFGAIGTVGYALTPARVMATPILSLIPKAAISLAQYTFAAAPAIYAGASVLEKIKASDLERKWSIFDSLPANMKKGYAQMAGYKDFTGLTDAQKGNVLLHYSVPPDFTLSQWLKVMGEYTEKLNEGTAKGSRWLHENFQPMHSWPASFALGTMGGIIEGASYLSQLPIVAASLAAKIPEADPKEYAKQVAEGFVSFFSTVLPMAWKADPTLALGRITGLFVLTPGSILKLAKGIGVRAGYRYIPERAMATEIPTLRLEFIKGNLGRLSNAARKRLGEKIVEQLVKGKAEATITIGGVVIKVRNVAFQQIVGDTAWHFTPDIRTFDPTKGTGTLYLGPQAAVQAGIASLVKGQRMTRPGLIEVHLPSKYKAPIQKLLRRGQVELEIPLRDRVYERIPGFWGKGVSANVQLGAYPIRRFTIKGAGSEFRGLSPKQIAQIRTGASMDVVSDAILGWRGRMMALKEKFSKPRSVRDIERSIRMLEEATPETIDAKGNIISQRPLIKHPTKPGFMRSRITAIVRNKQGAILLVKAVNDKYFYSLPGGRVEPIGKLPHRGWRTRRQITWAEGGRGQTQMETGVTTVSAANYRGIYLGKINEYALSGSRVVELTAKNPKINIRKYGDKELSHALWWDGTKKITVSPATYDILSSIPGINLKNLKVYKGSKLLNKSRDSAYATRAREGQFISEQNISRMNAVELRRLRAARLKAMKGEPPELAEWLTAENDIHFIAELIHGRRRAVKYMVDKELTLSEIGELYGTPELVTPKITALLARYINEMSKPRSEWNIRKMKGIVDEINTAMGKEFQKELIAYPKWLDKVYRDSYYTAREFFDRRYVNYLEKLFRAFGARPDVRTRIYEPEKVIARAYSQYVDRYRPEIPRRPAPPPPIYGKVVEPYIAEYPPVVGKYAAPDYDIPLIERPVIERRPPPEIPRVPRVPPPEIPRVPRVPPPEIPRVPRVPPPEVPRVTMPPIPVPVLTKPQSDLRIKESKGAFTWKQGLYWRVTEWPYRSPKDHWLTRELPLGATDIKKGIGVAYRSIQQIKGESPKLVSFDMGIQDAFVRRPSKKPGKKGAIKFKKDPRQVTRQTISLRGIRLR